MNSLNDLATVGSADDSLMAFQHRLCITDNKTNQIKFSTLKPTNYSRDDFQLLQHAINADQNSSNFFSKMPPSRLPGVPLSIDKYCLCCGITIYSTDNPVLNKGWSNASFSRRNEIIQDHIYFELGSFYYLSTDYMVPLPVRAEFQKYGLCADEFEDFQHIPPQLYVRISNRLIGDYVLTQNNIANPRIKKNSIGVADWSFDQHMTNRFAVPIQSPSESLGGSVSGSVVEYEVQLEGNFWPSIVPNPGNVSDKRLSSNWYDVPYEIMVPKKGTGTNLLVPVALSASAVAFSSCRIENMYMSIGTAAGIASVQLVSGKVNTVQEVNVTKVQEILQDMFQQRIHGPPFSKSVVQK